MVPTDSQPTRVLVVDDDEEFAATTAKKLAGRGFDAHAAFSGAEALAMLWRGAYDVAVVDLNMPGMDGIAVLRRTRDLASGLAVIVVTGFASVSAGIEGMQIGAADYLLKPVDIDRLSMSIEAAVEQDRTTRKKRD